MDPSIAALLSLEGRTALVTGAAGGIGEGIATMLRAAGATVVIGDIDTVGAKRVAADLDGLAVELDVTQADSAAAAIDATAAFAASSGARFDILINNAGTFLEAGSILDQSHDSWHRAIDVNLVGLFNCSKPAATHMVAAGGRGAIVNIASVDGSLPCLGTGYDTAKAGAIHFTRSLAVDLAPHAIRVNAISPGHVVVRTLERIHSGELPPLWPADSSKTGLMGPLMKQRSANIPIGRSGTPADIAKVALFLCSDAAGYITGQNLTVDGGWTLI